MPSVPMRAGKFRCPLCAIYENLYAQVCARLCLQHPWRQERAPPAGGAPGGGEQASHSGNSTSHRHRWKHRREGRSRHLKAGLGEAGDEGEKGEGRPSLHVF